MITLKAHLLIQNWEDPFAKARSRLGRDDRTRSMVDRIKLELNMDRSRRRDVVYKRVIIFKWLHKTKGYSLSQTGAIVCPEKPFDHATVIHGIKTANNLLECRDKVFKEIYTNTMEFINELENGQ